MIGTRSLRHCSAPKPLAAQRPSCHLWFPRAFTPVSPCPDCLLRMPCTALNMMWAHCCVVMMPSLGHAGEAAPPGTVHIGVTVDAAQWLSNPPPMGCKGLLYHDGGTWRLRWHLLCLWHLLSPFLICGYLAPAVKSAVFVAFVLPFTHAWLVSTPDMWMRNIWRCNGAFSPACRPRNAGGLPEAV